MTSVVDLAKAFERASLEVVWAWATHSNFPRRILRVLCGYFRHQRRVQFEDCVAEPLRRSRPFHQVEVELLEEALREALKVYPSMKDEDLR